MSNNWNTYKLSQVTTKIGSGSTPRGGQEAYKTSGTSLIRSQNVLDFTFSSNGLAFIDDAQASKLNNVTLEEDDVLLNITGDSVARVCQVPKELLPARVNQHVAIIRANKEKLNSSFLKYSLLETSNKNSLLNLASAGATRQAITKSMIEGFEIKLPPLQEQQSIASILSSIDDKIENNLTINKTLEEMAMALYKHWFVDFGPFQDGEFVESELGMIPKGWVVGSLKNILNFKKNNTQPTIEIKKMPYVPIDCIKSKQLLLDEFKSGEEANSSLIKFEKTDFIFGAMRAYFHKVCIAPFDGTTRSTAFVFNTHLDFQYSYGLCLLNYEDTINFASSNSQGSTIPYAKWDNVLSEMKTLLPTEDVLLKFDELNRKHFNKIIEIFNENQTLTQLRDALLPQLISGGVRLKEFRE